MENKNPLRNRLDTLIRDGRSGIIALIGDPGVENGLHYAIYYHNLGVVFAVHGDEYDEYLEVGDSDLVNRVLGELSRQPDIVAPEELESSETSFLAENLAHLLWHMAHDDSAEYDGFDYAELRERDGLLGPDTMTIDNAGWAFTIFGGNLASDIDRFHKLAIDGGSFSVAGREFSLDSYQHESGKTVRVLSLRFERELVDEDTGESFSIGVFVPVLGDSDWRTLYARARTFIYMNFVQRQKI